MVAPLIGALSQEVLEVAQNDPKAGCLQSVNYQDASCSSSFPCKSFTSL